MSAAPAVELEIGPDRVTDGVADDAADRVAQGVGHAPPVVPRRRPPQHRLVLVRPAPRREPPFDDELVAGRVSRRARLDPWLPFEAVPARSRPRRPLAVRPVGVPDPAVWGRRLLVGLAEAADGRRGLAQLNALLSPGVARGLATDFERGGGSGSRRWLRNAKVLGTRACEPADGVAEVSATVETGGRVRAVAMRLEVQDGRWRCVRLQLG